MIKKDSKQQPSYIGYDTKVGDIEKKYGLKPSVNSNKKIGDFFFEQGHPSLAKMLKGE